MSQNQKIIIENNLKQESKEAFTSLWEKIEANINNKTSDKDLPTSDIQKAKGYFSIWLKKQFIIPKWVYIIFSLLGAIYFLPKDINDIFPFMLIYIIVNSFYIMLEMYKRKYIYMVEMLGDLSQYNNDEDEKNRIFKLLSIFLWRIDSENLNKNFVIFSFLFTSIGVTLSIFKIQFALLFVVIPSFVFIFVDLILTIKFKETKKKD